jgi:hypothetical protein
VPFVLKYPEGRYQGYPRSSLPNNRKGHPKVDTLELARVYPTQTAAERSMAHKEGSAIPVAVVLMEPPNETGP